MAFNKNELILDRVRSATVHVPSTNELLFRLTSIEEPSLTTTAESEEVTDALGATIATLYRAKKGTFSGTNSLINLGLYAEQQGTKKVVGSADGKIEIPTYEVIEIPAQSTSVALSQVAKDPTKIKYIYSIVDGEIGTAYEAGTEVSATAFTVANATTTGEDDESITTTTINLPTGLTGKIYVEYSYEVENAEKVRVTASEFPKQVSVIIYAYFKDKCDENLVYSGIIVIPKAKLNPESVELALTATGKHPFEFTMAKDYCQEEGSDELFSIIVAE